MIQNYTFIELRNENQVSKMAIKDFKGDWDLNRNSMKNAKDEDGIMFYTFYDGKNRIVLKGVDPEGNGFIEILTRY